MPRPPNFRDNTKGATRLAQTEHLDSALRLAYHQNNYKSYIRLLKQWVVRQFSERTSVEEKEFANQVDVFKVLEVMKKREEETNKRKFADIIERNIALQVNPSGVPSSPEPTDLPYLTSKFVSKGGDVRHFHREK